MDKITSRVYVFLVVMLMISIGIMFLHILKFSFFASSQLFEITNRIFGMVFGLMLVLGSISGIRNKYSVIGGRGWFKDIEVKGKLAVLISSLYLIFGLFGTIYSFYQLIVTRI